MIHHSDNNARPTFLLIFGAAGSGNTFMFNCITQDEQVYGVNEDAFGSTIERLLQSEEEMGKCPHSVSMFIDFLHALRNDRPTLVLKTPSNLRRIDLFRKYLPRPSFIAMIREPHAAIVSGLSRHKQSVEDVAELWRNDCELLLSKRGEDVEVVSFEEFVRDPRHTFQRLQERVIPLSPNVEMYAGRVNRPERSDPAWWQKKISSETANQIRECVQRMQLGELYSQATGGTFVPTQPEAASTFWRPLTSAKKQFFRGWYKVFR